MLLSLVCSFCLIIILMQVPILNATTIRWVQPNTLVRFRGMIQDMLGNELYVGAYKVVFSPSYGVIVITLVMLWELKIFVLCIFEGRVSLEDEQVYGCFSASDGHGGLAT